MGDRVYVSIQIHGPINTTAALEALTLAIEDDLGYGSEGEDVAGVLLEAIAKNEPHAFFEAEEVNYGNVTTIRAACAEHGIGFIADWGAGCEFDAGRATLHPGDEKDDECPANSNDQVLVPLSELEACMRGDVLAAFGDLVRRYRKIEGKTLPNLAVSAAVMDVLNAEETVAA